MSRHVVNPFGVLISLLAILRPGAIEGANGDGMLTTQWDQIWPYNARCPTDPNACTDCNGRVLAGCGAVAVGQVMRYHRYPVAGIGTHSYQSNYGTLSADFSDSAYEWDSMPPVLSTTSSTECINAVAGLLYEVGVSMETAYAASASAADGYGVWASLVSYFAYSASLQIVKRVDYSSSDWLNLLTNELLHGRPVIYYGLDALAESPHGFVIDSLRQDPPGQFRFHCNLGGGGQGDGYFSLDSLYVNNRKLELDHRAFIYLAPPTVPAPVGLRWVRSQDRLRLIWNKVDAAGVIGYCPYFWPPGRLEMRYVAKRYSPPTDTTMSLDVAALLQASGQMTFAVTSIGPDSLVSRYSDSLVVTYSEFSSPVVRGLTPRPGSIALLASPNPFLSHTVVEMDCPSEGNVGPFAFVNVLDCHGTVVRYLLARRFGAQRARVLWDGSDQAGRPLPAGQYFLILSSGAGSDGIGVIKMK